MTSKKETTETTPANAAKGKRRRSSPSSAHTAEAKAQAVLAIWTERVKIAEVARTLGVPYMTLQQWQQRAPEDGGDESDRSDGILGSGRFKRRR